MLRNYFKKQAMIDAFKIDNITLWENEISLALNERV